MRMIDADYGQKQLTIAEVECGKNFETDCNHVRDFLNAMPTIDAVPVVRCKDCIHWYDVEGVCLKIYSDGAVSSYAWQFREPNDFCSYGKHKEET